MPSLTFTPSLFYQQATCPHWVWHDRFSDPALKGELPELAKKLQDQGVQHEEDYIRGLDLQRVDETDPAPAAAHTLALMQAGAPLIYQGALEYTDPKTGVTFRGRPDLLEKLPGSRSRFGDYAYQPVDIKSTRSLKDTHQLQLALYASLLEHIQDAAPAQGAIINRDGDRLDCPIDAELKAKLTERTNQILAVLRGEKPPLKLTSSCKQGPWFQQCLADAEAANDIALLYNLDSRGHATLRQAGIRTVADAARMDVDRLPKIPQIGVERLERAKLQAQALETGELRWLAPLDLPAPTPVNIYFDIEGDPLLDVQYLWGFWIAGDPNGRFAKHGEVRWHGDRYFLYFLAETPDQEDEMWRTFLQWLQLLPPDGADYTVWHFHHYERTQCTGLSEAYGGSPALDRFMERLVDLSPVVLESVVLPLYFYSIKDIAKSPFLGYQWRHAQAGGAQSIFWYEKWLETKDRAVLDDIINYNEDDVRATEHLHKWLQAFVPTAKPGR